MTEIKLVIFDMDGLMFDTERLTKDCWGRACETLGFVYRPEVFHRTIGRDIVDSERIVLEGMGADFPFQEARALRDRYVLEYAEEHGTPLKPGLCELLDELDAQGIRRVVATSTEEYRASRLIGYAGLTGRFDGIVYGNEVANGKPFPDIFLKAADGLPPQQCLVLEDSPAGVEAAFRAGMPVALIPDLAVPDETVLARCTVKLETLHGVIGYIRQRAGKPA